MKAGNKVIVVTGGGSGMGREIVLELLRRGAIVAMCDINEAALQETVLLAGDFAKNLSSHRLDIADKDQVMAFPEVILKTHGAVDGVINNAGIIQPFVPVVDLDYVTIERVFNINFYGTLYMTKAFLPHLLKRSEAHLVNVGSMGGFIPFPGQTAYSASKGAVKMLTEGLYAELQNSPVKVTLIMPGAIHTNIMVNSGLEAPKSQNSNVKMLAADAAARMIVDAMENDKYRVFVGSDSKMLDKLYRLFPAWATRFIAKQMANAGK